MSERSFRGNRWVRRSRFIVFFCAVTAIVGGFVWSAGLDQDARTLRSLAICCGMMAIPVLSTFLLLGYTHIANKEGKKGKTSMSVVFILIAYLVLGISYGLVYWISESIGGEVKLNKEVLDGTQHLGAYMYYSFVTASTLGYGEGLPMNGVTRILACLEVIEFWLFFAIGASVIQDAYSSASYGEKKTGKELSA